MAHGPDTEELLRRISVVVTTKGTYLDVSRLRITSLPTLPHTLETLVCEHMTRLTSLPDLPPNLTKLICGYSSIQSLPKLPNYLKTLMCNNTGITEFPSLPRGLQVFVCSHLSILKLPPLPPYLIKLICNDTLINSLPPLPHTLECLNCISTNIVTLPPLPDSLSILKCDNCPLAIKLLRSETVQNYKKRLCDIAKRHETILSIRRCQTRCLTVKEELMAAAWHPSRIERLLNAGYSFEEVLGD